MKKSIVFCIIIVGVIFSAACFAAEPVSEAQIKAGFLYKFLFFAEWPEEAFVNDEAPIMIGILGKDPFGNVFQAVEGQHVEGRKLIIKRFNKNTSAEALRQCQLLFISPSLKAGIEKLLESLKNYPVITVSEVKKFTYLGGMINFVKKNNKVAFEVNRAAAERVGIKFRSRLLRVANRVIED
jgi:hypothetical protein